MLSGSDLRSAVSALRWVTIMIACVFAADAAVDGSVRSVVAIALVAAVAVGWTLRHRAVDRYQDMAATLVIAAAAVIAEPSAAFIPAIVMSLAIMVIEPRLAPEESARNVATAGTRPDGPSATDTAEPEKTAPAEPTATLAERRAESIEAQSEVDDDVRNRAARVAERTAEWLTFTKIGLDRHLSIRPDPRLSELRDDVQGAIEEVGHRVEHLHMTVDDATSLGQHLRAQLRWWKKHYVAKTTLTIDDEPRRLSQGVEQTLLGIAQEAFDNAGRYAQADHLEVRWEVTDNAATLSIADDGVGFDLEGKRANGIDAMQRAAGRIGADYSITSVLGVGTAISVRIDTP